MLSALCHVRIQWEDATCKPGISLSPDLGCRHRGLGLPSLHKGEKCLLFKLNNKQMKTTKTKTNFIIQVCYSGQITLVVFFINNKLLTYVICLPISDGQVHRNSGHYPRFNGYRKWSLWPGIQHFFNIRMSTWYQVSKPSAILSFVLYKLKIPKLMVM